MWRSKRYRIANRIFKDKGRAEHCANFKAKHETPVRKTGKKFFKNELEKQSQNLRINPSQEQSTDLWEKNKGNTIQKRAFSSNDAAHRQ